jgi:Pectate lyase/Bacterial TSP3 repeat
MRRRTPMSRPSMWPVALLMGACVGCAAGGAPGSTGAGGAAIGTGGAAGGPSTGTGGATGGGTGGATGGGTGGAGPVDAGAGRGGSSAGGSGGAGAGGSAGSGGVTGAGGSATGAGGSATGAGGSATGTGGSTPPGLPAFPGADGAGALIKGGRGGTVYHVTRLDTDYSDVTPGTLRYGLTQLTGARTIVFDVSGVISLGRAAVAGWDSGGNGWDTQSRLNIPADVTIAGQTAPGPIIIMGGTVNANANDIILRNVTFAPGYGNRSFNEPTRVPVVGDFPDSYTYDAIDISATGVMIDHITAVYATDETVSMNELASNVTVQFSNIAQGQNYPQADAEATSLTYTGHALGSLFQAGSNAKVSILHNLYAHLKGRLPRVGTEATALTTAGVGAYNDFRNNVFYNWMSTAGTGAAAQASQNNFINNFYLAGNGGDNPVGGTSTALATTAGGTAIFNGDDATLTKVFHAGNFKDINRDGDALDGVALTNADFTGSAIQTAAFTQAPYYGVTATATAAFTQVLNVVGARWWARAAIDTRIINETRTGTGKIIAWADDPFNTDPQEGVEWRSLRATPLTARPAGFDTDNDGMPDAWELAHGLNPSVADNNGDFDNDGYTNLEEYINEIAAWPAVASVLFRGTRSTRFAEIHNWTVDPHADASPASARNGAPAAAPWQPNRYDVAQIRTGTAVVDAVGQHAGTLQVAAAHAGVATLNITGGWLEVADRLEIGAWSPTLAGARAAWPDTRPGRTRVAGAGVTNQTGGTLFVGRAIVMGGPADGGRAAPPATLRLSGGRLVTPALLRAGAGGRFDFTGGTLQAGRVGFDLVDQGGTIAPGPAAAGKTGRTDVLSNLIINQGTLAIDVQPSAADLVSVTGRARLGGALEMKPIAGYAPRPGDSWTILVAAGGVTGTFARVTPGYSVRVVGDRVVVTFGAPAPLAGAARPARGPG